MAGSRDVLKWLAGEISPGVTVSLMSLYRPMHKAYEYPLLSRSISQFEYDSVCSTLEKLGMENGWVQKMGAQELYLPDFEREGHPFVA
jgi:putative pyruvate formate lyase activating enzyme